MQIDIEKVVTAKQAINIVDELFVQLRNTSPTEVENFWDIISALRGPDQVYETDVKGATTSVIRSYALPKAKEIQFDLPGIFEDDSTYFADVRVEADNSVVGSHFLNHAHRAFSALGLMWHSVNE